MEILLCILGGVLCLFLLYVLFLWICALLVDPNREYENDSRKCCFMAIDRENPRNAIVIINKAAQLLKRQEVSVGIYPEGTRSKTCRLLPFHNGVFKIAQKAEVPVAVVSVTGTEKIAKRTPFRSTEVYLDVLEVISAEGIKSSKTDQIGTTVRCLIESNIDRRNKEWQKDM